MEHPGTSLLPLSVNTLPTKLTTLLISVITGLLLLQNCCESCS